MRFWRRIPGSRGEDETNKLKGLSVNERAGSNISVAFLGADGFSLGAIELSADEARKLSGLLAQAADKASPEEDEVEFYLFGKKVVPNPFSKKVVP